MKVPFISILLLVGIKLYGQDLKAFLDSFPLPQKITKPANWIEADKHRTFYYEKYPDSMGLNEAMKVIKSEKDFSRFLQAKTWCIDHYQEALPYLLESITDTTKVGLINTADLIIDDRINTGELKFWGHGGAIFEDIFTVCGRCSYILHELTGENFARVHIYTTKESLKVYQEIWVNWFYQL